MTFSKKGQGLPINVIIVAALALIVLVVLVVIFTQQTGQFGQKVAEETKTELFKMRIFYGQCRPGESFENAFMSQFDSVGTDQERDSIRSSFRGEIDRCKEFGENKESCESGSGCVWS